MHTHFVRSIVSAASVDVSTLTPDSSKSLAYLCRDLLSRSESIQNASLKTQVKQRLGAQLVAAYKRSKS